MFCRHEWSKSSHFIVLWDAVSCQLCKNPGSIVNTSKEEDIILLCILVMFAHCYDPPIVVREQKVALWCAKWFTKREDTNKLFVREPGQEVPSNFKRSLWINNSPRSISLLSFCFPSLQELSGTALDLGVYRCHCKMSWIKVYLATCFQPWNMHHEQHIQRIQQVDNMWRFRTLVSTVQITEEEMRKLGVL